MSKSFIPNPDAHWKENQICTMLGVYRQTLRDWVAAGLMPKPNQYGLKKAWPKKVIAAWLLEAFCKAKELKEKPESFYNLPENS